MIDLSSFLKHEFLKNNILDVVEQVDTIEDSELFAARICRGEYINLKFKSSSVKEHFIDIISTMIPDVNIINCNCSLNKFNENCFDNRLLIFNNVKLCKHAEILEEIKNYKGILIC